MPIITDHLVRKAQAGDKSAFVRLMEDHQLAMYRTAKAILHNETDVEDAIQEAICRAFSKIYSLRQPKFFKTWLTRVVINCCYDLLRQQKGLFPLEVLPEEGREEDMDTPLDVRQALQSLTENDRLVMTLYYLNDLPVKEIAGLLSVSEGAVKMRLSHGRRKLRDSFESKEREAGI